MYLCLIPCIMRKVSTNNMNYTTMKNTVYIYTFFLELKRGYS